MNNGYLYRHIRLDTNEIFYIGIGFHRKSGNKYMRAFNTYKRNEFWKNIIKKSSFEVEIVLDNLPKEELLIKEKEFIELYGRKDLNKGSLVNLTDGGEGTCGHKIIGRKMDEEQRLSMIGRKLSQETKDKISKAHLGRKHDKSLYIERSKKLRGRKVPHSCKSVIQKTMSGDFVKDWESARSTSVEGFSPQQVGNACRGVTKSHRGFKWEFKHE